MLSDNYCYSSCNTLASMIGDEWNCIACVLLNSCIANGLIIYKQEKFYYNLSIQIFFNSISFMIYVDYRLLMFHYSCVDSEVRM